MTSNRDGVKFAQDLNVLVERLTTDIDDIAIHKLNSLRDALLQLHRENVVKINHSVMELVCAKYLILKDYTVKLEQKLSDILTCDLYATKGYGNLIVEIETGYIPPEHAMDPLTYTYARLASKIIRYSCFSGKFAIGIPPHYVLPLPRVLTLPPKKRTPQAVEEIKNLCDWYYQNPPVTEEGIKNARIHEIYIIDVDRTMVQAMDPTTYMKRALHKGVIFTLNEEPLTKRSKPDYPPRYIEKLDKYLLR
ncbi:MAG: hypothetical protein ACQXXJ_01535 [Candidatus Bathyarchaeia archaeon]|jgi:hypothetical protein